MYPNTITNDDAYPSPYYNQPAATYAGEIIARHSDLSDTETLDQHPSVMESMINNCY